ncbi:MAG: transposase [Lewinellaceae bacterium]|nr:transposase [Lewinellaceae bacterium]
MPPKMPLEPGQSYHIYNRGNNRDLLFREEENYHYFLRLAQKHIAPVADIYAYALLPDHFHFLARVKDEEELVRIDITTSRKVSSKFGHWFNAYAKAYNKRYNRVSSLFEKNFERSLLSDESHFLRILFYIHWNPQKHKYLKDYRDWPYSSYQALLSDAPTFLARTQLLEWFGGKDGFIQAHDAYLSDLNDDWEP